MLFFLLVWSWFTMNASCLISLCYFGLIHFMNEFAFSLCELVFYFITEGFTIDTNAAKTTPVYSPNR